MPTALPPPRDSGPNWGCIVALAINSTIVILIVAELWSR